MKSVALVVVALGLLAVTATPLVAHEHWSGGYCGPVYHHGYYYGGYRPVVVVPGPAYATAYAPVAAPGGRSGRVAPFMDPLCRVRITIAFRELALAIAARAYLLACTFSTD